MKKYILVIIALAMISLNGIASTNAISEKLAINVSQANNFTLDLGDVTNMPESEIAQKINEFLEANLASLPVLQCSVTITGSVTVPGFEIGIEITVSGDCSEVKSEGIALATAMLKAIQDFLSNFL